MENVIRNLKSIIWILAVFVSLGMYNKAQAACGTDTVTYGGQTYNTVQIGTQCWFRQNLNVGTMLASAATLPSDPAPTASDPNTVQKWCLNNSTTNCTNEGGLYTWAEANGLASSCNTTICTPPAINQGICPAGWHIPSSSEYITLTTYLGTSTAGTQMKVISSTTFSMLLSGYRNTSNLFYSLGEGFLWTATPVSASSSTMHWTDTSGALLNSSNYPKVWGFPVRCVRNASVVEIPTLTTNAPSAITSTTATGNATIIATGGNNPTAFIEWGTTSGIYANSCSPGTVGVGAYSCAMTNLTPNTMYYVNAYATNSAGTVTGTQTTFTTPALPVITITNPNTSASQSKIITASVDKGVLTQSVTTGSLCDSSLTFTTYQSISFSAEADNGKKICYRSIDASSGTSYLMSNAISGIDTTIPTITSVTSNCQNTTDPNFIITASDNTSLASSPYSFDAGATWQTQNFKTYTDLSHTIEVGAIKVKDAAGNIATYNAPTTQICVTAPTVSTAATTNILTTTATGNGTIISTGNENPTRTIEWGIISGNYTNSCSAGIGGIGNFSCDMTSLLPPNTKYYLRAKATNSAGTAYGSEVSFTTLPVQDIVITNPDNSKVSNAVNGGYMDINSGTTTSTDSAQTKVNVTIRTTSADTVLPTNTIVTKTGGGNFNFASFVSQDVTSTVKTQIATSVMAIKIGVPNIGLTFSQPITLTLNVGTKYDGETMDVFYQNDGESDWHSQASCTITSGKCSFQTDHATTYSVNGSGNAVGETGINLNTDVQEIISLDCGTSTINLGNLTPGTPITGSSTCTATTNANGGYNLSVRRDDATSTLKKNTENSVTISDLTPWDPTAPNANTWSGTGLGFTVYHSTANKNTSWWGAGTTLTDANNRYAGFNTNQTDIMRDTTYSETSTATDIGYMLSVPPTQKSGAYSGSVTYQAVTTP